MVCHGFSSDGSPCLKECVNDSNWCIFHYPNKTDELISRFENEFQKEWSIQEKAHPDYYDFTGYDFPIFLNFQSETLPKISFNKCTFRKDIHFKNVIFNGRIDFRECIFKYGLFMINCDINDDILMHSSEFLNHTFIYEVNIGGNIDIFNTTIHKRFEIMVSKWNSLNKGIKYKNREIGGSFRLDNPIIHDNKILLSGKISEFNEKIVGGFLFFDSDINKFRFIDEAWSRIGGNMLGRKFIFDEIILDIPLETLLESIGFNPTAGMVAQAYRKLRQLYEDDKRYSEAGDFFVSEMEVKRNYHETMHEKDTLKPKKRSFLDPIRVLYTLYFELSKYGESIFLPIIWSGLTLFLFSFINTIFCCPIKDQFFWYFLSNSFPNIVMAFFPFSEISTPFFLLIRIIGVILLTLLLIALKRHFERK